MSSFTVQQGKRYRATITLGWLERWADNEMIASRFRDAGFSDVRVTGTGNTRVAEGRWPGGDTSAQMPSQVSEVTEI